MMPKITRLVDLLRDKHSSSLIRYFIARNAIYFLLFTVLKKKFIGGQTLVDQDVRHMQCLNINIVSFFHDSKNVPDCLMTTVRSR